jgi:hypothetical protein
VRAYETQDLRIESRRDAFLPPTTFHENGTLSFVHPEQQTRGCELEAE